MQRISLQLRVNRDDKIFQCQNIILNYGIRGYINSGVRRRTYNETNFPLRCLKAYLTYVFKRGLKRRYPTEIITKWADNLNLTQIKLLDKVFKMEEPSESSEIRAAAKEAKKIKSLEKKKIKDDKKKQQKMQKLEKIQQQLEELNLMSDSSTTDLEFRAENDAVPAITEAEQEQRVKALKQQLQKKQKAEKKMQKLSMKEQKIKD